MRKLRTSPRPTSGRRAARTRPGFRQARLCTMQQLTGVVDGDAEDLGDFRMRVLENFFEQEYRTFFGSQRFEQHEKRERDRLRTLKGAVRPLQLGSEHGLGQPRDPTYCSRAARADFRRSRQRRVTIVVAKALGDRIADASVPRGTDERPNERYANGPRSTGNEDIHVNRRSRTSRTARPEPSASVTASR